MNRKILKNNKGASVIEVLISLAMASIIILAVGSALSSIHKLNTTSAVKEKALAYAKQSMEIVSEIKNNEYACICDDSGTCTKQLSTKGNNGEICTCPLPSPAYKSCWLPYPDGITTDSPYYLNDNHQLTPGVENINNTPFTREINIENISGDSNRKKVTVTVAWPGSQQGIGLSTIFTAWENL